MESSFPINTNPYVNPNPTGAAKVVWYQTNNFLPLSGDSCRPSVDVRNGWYETKESCLRDVAWFQSEVRPQKWYRVDDNLGHCIAYRSQVNGPPGAPNPPRVFDTYAECSGKYF